MTDVTATVTLRWRADNTVPHPALAPVPFAAATITVRGEDSHTLRDYARALAEADAAIGATHGIVDYTLQHIRTGEVMAHGSIDIDAHNRQTERAARAMLLLATLAHPQVAESVFRKALADARAMLDAMKGEG